MHGTLTYKYTIFFKIYFSLCLVYVSRVSFQSNIVMSIILKVESYASFKYHK